jgi:hypothetical protein
MKQSQHLDFAIASLHFITLAMTKYIFTHLGCSHKKSDRTLEKTKKAIAITLGGNKSDRHS